MDSNIVKQIIRESVIKSYVEAINTMSVIPIKELIHPDFYFRLKGIDLDIKGGYTYIKHLARAFWDLVEEDKSLDAEMVYLQAGEHSFPCIKLHPPIDTKFLISLKKVYATDGGYPEHYEDAILYITVKDEQLFRVYCYGSEKHFRKESNLKWIERKELNNVK